MQTGGTQGLAGPRIAHRQLIYTTAVAVAEGLHLPHMESRLASRTKPPTRRSSPRPLPQQRCRNDEAGEFREMFTCRSLVAGFCRYSSVFWILYPSTVPHLHTQHFAAFLLGGWLSVFADHLHHHPWDRRRERAVEKGTEQGSSSDASYVHAVS